MDEEGPFRKVRNAKFVSKKVRTPAKTPRCRKKAKLSSGATKLVTPKKRGRPSLSKITLEVPNSDKGRGLKLIHQGKHVEGFRLLFKSSKYIRKAGLKVIAELARKEVKESTKNLKSATRGPINFDVISGFSWSKLISEAKRNMPILLEIIVACLTDKKRHSEMTIKTKTKLKSAVPLIGSIISQVMFSRNRQCSIFQQLNSIILWLNGCKRKLFASLSSLGLCTSITTARKGLDRCRTKYDSQVHDWKKTVSTFMDEKEKNAEKSEIMMKDLESEWEDIGDWEVSSIDQDDDFSQSISDANTGTELSSTLSVENTSSTGADSVASDKQTDDTLDDSCAKSISSMDSINTIGPAKSISNGAYLYDITFDNLNQKVHVRHHRKGAHTQQLNMVQAFATRDRVPSGHLSDTEPTANDVRNITTEQFLPNQKDEEDLKEEMVIMVKRILTKRMKAFNHLEDKVVQHIPHEYSKESSLKSHIVPLGVLNKDETKTSEMVDILEEYHKYVPSEGNQPLRIPLFGDGLSCERVVSAQQSRINGESKWDRLEGLEPAIQEWHRRQILLQDTYDKLFKAESQRDVGTLYQVKQMFDFRSVSSNIMECFHGASELLEFSTEAYICAAAIEFLNLSSIDEELKDQDAMETLNSVALQIVEYVYMSPNIKDICNVQVSLGRIRNFQYCICNLNIGGEMVYCFNKKCEKGSWFHLECLGVTSDELPEGDWFCCSSCQKEASKKPRKRNAANLIDSKQEYVKQLLWYGLNDLIRHDAVKENDGVRMIRHWKFDILQFFEEGHPKYFIFAHRLIASVEGAVSPRLQHQLLHNRTVNIKGGKGKNKEKDLQCEHINHRYKGGSKVAGGQLTANTIARHSQMLGLGDEISTFYDNSVVQRQKHYMSKHGKPDRLPDIKLLVDLLCVEDLFQTSPGRYFKGFSDFNFTTHVKQPRKFKERLLKHKEILAVRREVIANN